MIDKNLTKKSRYLSLLLRHKPEQAGLIIDEAGWTDVDILLANTGFDIETLELVVENNNKNRFEFSLDRTKIRARQGHSIKVNLGYGAVVPPEFLYHGTATKMLDSIFEDGLRPMNRHQVHLSPDLETAMAVGARHGKSIVLRVKALDMANELNTEFFVTDNNVWLVDYVPREYLEFA